MIEPKPMSPERRAEIEADIAQLSTEGPMWTVMVSELRDLLADSAYWRQQLGRVDPCQNYHAMCQWCEATDHVETHKPDCPWLKAQEGR